MVLILSDDNTTLVGRATRERHRVQLTPEVTELSEEVLNIAVTLMDDGKSLHQRILQSLAEVKVEPP